VSGLVSVSLGVAMIAWPGKAAIAIAWLIGGYAILSGLLHLAFAIELHQLTRNGRRWAT